MERFEKRVNRYLSITAEKFVIKELYYLMQVSCSLMYLRGPWIYFSLFQFSSYFFILVSYLFLSFYTTILIKDYQLSIAVQVFHIMGGIVMSIGILLWYTFNRDKMAQLFSLIHNNFYEYDTSFDKETIQPWLKEVTVFKNKLFVFISILLIAIGLQAMVAGPIQDMLQGTVIEDIYINKVYMQLPVPLYFPFSITNNMIELLCLIYESIVTFVLLSVLCSAMIMVVYTIQSVNVQFKILNYSIMIIEQRALNKCKAKYKDFKIYNNKIELYLDPNFIKEYNLCIKENVEHHYQILRGYRLVDEIEKWPLFIVIFFISIIIACALFTLLKGETRIAPQLFSFLLLILELIIMLIICKGGQELSDQNDELFRVFYKTNWFYCSRGIKNSIGVIQEKCKKTLSYKAGGLTDVNWELFSAIMNTAYTYFNLMRAMKDTDS